MLRLNKNVAHLTNVSLFEEAVAEVCDECAGRLLEFLIVGFATLHFAVPGELSQVGSEVAPGCDGYDVGMEFGNWFSGHRQCQAWGL